MLKVERVGKRYGTATALQDVSFEAKPGEVLALIGANGAGKTTLIKCVLGLLRCDGRVTIDGIDVGKRGKKARSRMGYVAQSPAFHPDMSVRETVAFYAGLRKATADEGARLIEAAGLGDHLEKKAGALSGGMQQRLALAVASLGSPKVLVLDEPASGLDVMARIDLRERIAEFRRQGTTVLLSTHWLEDVPYVADTTLVLDRGRLVYSGNSATLANMAETRSRMYLRLNGHTPEAIPMIAAITGLDVERTGDWVIARIPATRKAELVETLLNNGVGILDFRVEEATVDEAVRQLSDSPAEVPQ